MKLKHATYENRGKICDRCKARENLRSVKDAGRHVTGVKRLKRVVFVAPNIGERLLRRRPQICNRCKPRENAQLFLAAFSF